METANRATLETHLVALEAALPFLRQSMSADELQRHIAECRRELLADAATEEDVAYMQHRLARMLEAPPAVAPAPPPGAAG